MDLYRDPATMDPEELRAYLADIREELEAMGLGVPQVTKLGSLLQNRGFRMEDTVLTVDQMVGQIRANFHK